MAQTRPNKLKTINGTHIQWINSFVWFWWLSAYLLKYKSIGRIGANFLVINLFEQQIQNSWNRSNDCQKLNKACYIYRFTYQFLNILNSVYRSYFIFLTKKKVSTQFKFLILLNVYLTATSRNKRSVIF